MVAPNNINRCPHCVSASEVTYNVTEFSIQAPWEEKKVKTEAGLAMYLSKEMVFELNLIGS